jgi:transposase
LVELATEAVELEAKVKWYEAQMLLSKQKTFGISSEKSDSNQLVMFDEAECAADENEPEPQLENIHKRGIRRKGNKEYITSELSVETVEYRLTAEEQVCPKCGNSLHEMSKVIRKELTVIPAKVVVTEHVRYVYACRNCEKNDIEVPVITSPMPSPVIKNSLASPSLIAYIMCRKYEEVVPLYCQEVQMFYYGLEIKRQNMANWIIYSWRHYLTHLYARMHELLLQRDILHADETTVQVLYEDQRKPEQKSYMWMYRTGKDYIPIILYEYQPGRGSKHPQAFLSGYQGYLHTDGYEAYNKLTVDTNGHETGVILCGCWAHARRNYDEAIKALPKEKSIEGLAVRRGLDVFYLDSRSRCQRYGI